MNIKVKLAKKAIQDKLESEIKAAAAKLETLKARAETAKADIEIKAVGVLLTKQRSVLQKLRELKKSGGAGGSRRKPTKRSGSKTSRSR